MNNYSMELSARRTTGKSKNAAFQNELVLFMTRYDKVVIKRCDSDPRYWLKAQDIFFFL